MTKKELTLPKIAKPKPKPAHPSFKDMIKDAIIQLVRLQIDKKLYRAFIVLTIRRKKRDLVVKQSKNTLKLIIRYFLDDLILKGLPATFISHLNIAIKKGVAEKILLQTKGTFKLASSTVKVIVGLLEMEGDVLR